jgi:hypothetical protein
MRTHAIALSSLRLFCRSVIEDELSYRAEPLVHTRRGIGSLQTAACLNEDTDIFS